ncbi:MULTISPECIES: AsnC family protein [unclassified Endozoicomonas]|uniref:AsnC family protein n=1 Tax=unclassified Endozoicomonas TaxID=2644528 RepID=UPI003BB7AEC4
MDKIDRNILRELQEDTTPSLAELAEKDIQSFDCFYKALVNTVEGLTDVTSSFAMEQMKFTTALPL